MKINQVIEVLNFLDVKYSISEFNEKVNILEPEDLCLLKDADCFDEIVFYFDKNTKVVIPNYLEQLEIKKQIKALKEKLKSLEKVLTNTNKNVIINISNKERGKKNE